MIRGFARLTDKSRVRLAIVGDGDCRAKLEALAAELQVGHCVTFTGAVRDVASVLAESDIFVSTSRSEGMSNALLEAMSFGVVPLVSRVSGASEIVEEGGCGLLFAPGDLDAFAARLEELLALPLETRQAFAARARAIVAEKYGIEQIAQRHVALYRQVLTQPS